MHACSSDENVLEPKEPTIKIRERTHTNKRPYKLTQRQVPKRFSSEEKLFIILRYPSLILNRFQTTVVSTHSCFWGWWRFTMHTLYKARKTLPQSEGIKVRMDPSCRSSSVASTRWEQHPSSSICSKTLKRRTRKFRRGCFVIDLSWSVCPDLSIKFLISQAGTPDLSQHLCPDLSSWLVSTTVYVASYVVCPFSL